MKKVLVIAALALFLLPNAAKAQLGRGELSVGYGWNPSTSWMKSYNALDGVARENKWGGVSLDYSFRVLGGLGVGASLIYSSVDQKTASDNVKTHYYSVMPFVKLRWLNLKVLRLYSRAGVGWVYEHAKGGDFLRDKNKLAWQVSPLGIEVGGMISAYAEAGIGTAGTVIAGLRFRF